MIRLGYWILGGVLFGLVTYILVAVMAVLNDILPLGWIAVLILIGVFVSALFDLIGPRLEPPPTDEP